MVMAKVMAYLKAAWDSGALLTRPHVMHELSIALCYFAVHAQWVRNIQLILPSAF